MGRGRRSIARRLLPFCGVLLFASHTAAADQNGRVQLDVVMSDASGRPVTGLKAQEFKLYVDGEDRQIATFAGYDDFTAKPDPPSQMIIVIDAVNNGFVEMGYMRQGLEKFLRENEGRLGQPTTIAQLASSGIQFLSQPSLDGNALAAIVERLDANVKLKGVDVLPISLNAIVTVAKNEAGAPGRKLLVWLGPGWPTPMPPSATPTAVDERDQRAYYAISIQIAKLLHDARMVLYGGYSAGDFYMRDFLKPVKKATDMDARGLRLNVLAIKSGGNGELPETNRDRVVTDALEHITAEANSFYAVSFDSPEAKGEDTFHQVRVEVKWRVLTSRTISGYYDEAEQVPLKETKLKKVKVRPPDSPDRNALRPVTVAQLADAVEEAKGKPDGEAAKQIERLRLTERLSSSKLPGLIQNLPGEKAKAALMGVGDASAFLVPPEDETPKVAVPDLAEQRQILSRAVDYLKTIHPKLPDFYAKRFTTSFVRVTNEVDYSNGVLRRDGGFKATVLFRDGKEVVRAEGAQERGLVTQGTFGPILSAVILDAAHGKTEWSRWEERPSGPIAVFRIEIQLRESHYQVSFPPMFGQPGVMGPTAYHGEIGIDLHSGAILRLVQEADPELGSPMHRADLMVEYGPVEIGGKTYTCPVRSVSISSGDVMSFVNGRQEIREIMRLNDVVFSDYHVFRSEMRIVP